MMRREFSAVAATLLSTGCLGMLGSESSSGDGKIAVESRNCGEVSQTAKCESNGQKLSIRGAFGVEDTCRTLDYSLFTTANSKSPKRVYLDVTAIDGGVESCTSCRGTLGYSATVTLPEDIDIAVVSHVVEGEQIEVARVETQ
ncbi:hypothetical protein [Halorussus pelagicus]|uniref:hypothetical protein n=1 Tax=Halorussus pelagicus TaxID=2505977 RepID=UPI000FFBB5B2|nr:hypothetical protein [Halorussus pelagicus]